MAFDFLKRNQLTGISPKVTQKGKETERAGQIGHVVNDIKMYFPRLLCKGTATVTPAEAEALLS